MVQVIPKHVFIKFPCEILIITLKAMEVFYIPDKCLIY